MDVTTRVRVGVLAVGAATVCSLGSPAGAQQRTLNLLTATIADIQQAVDAGALTYEQLAQRYLDRVAAYDRKGPRLNAVIAVNPEALADARARDEERRRRGRRGPLHGIPVAVKDNIDVRGLPTSGGHPLLQRVAAAADATVVQRLRDAGAVILIKTNLDELALGTRGFSTLGGQMLNPYDLTRGPGGSSGGTAIAVNAAFATVGLATETGFSIRSPASNNALAAIAPSRGRVSRAGVLPISFTQDRVGVHAKSVADAALVLAAIEGFDADDLSTSAVLDHAPLSPASRNGGTVRDVRLGVLGDLFRSGAQFAEGHTIVDSLLASLRTQGVAVTDRLSTGLDLIAQMPQLRVNSFELQTAFDAYVRRRGASSPVDSFAAFAAAGQFAKGGTLAGRFQETLKAGRLDRNAEYLARLARQREIRQALVALMDRHAVDALAYPVKALTAPAVGLADDGPRDNNVSAVTGLPAIVVTAGFAADGLPIAIELLGRPFADGRLIEIAAAVDGVARARRPPPSTPPLPGDVVVY